MVSLTLLSTVLMGLLVVATLVAADRIGTRRTPPGEEPTDRYAAVTERLSELARTPAVWSIVFVALTLGIGFTTVLAVGNFGLPEGTPGLLLNVLYALVGLLVFAFVFLGAYFAARGRGLGNAHGIAAGSFAAGVAFLVLIVAQLVVGVIG